ncbi:MAG TPA: hypothetical protein PLD86_01560 [Vicinamibacteria bacterium]|nr:hypothetical protein [Vicinamibacteria bacterium]
MKYTKALSVVLVGVAALWSAAPAEAQKPTPPVVAIPQSGVPQIMTLEGKFVRAAYNNEGYVILGYQPANRSVGEEWLLVEVGITVRDGVKAYELTRGAISLDTPDGKTLPLPTVPEFREGKTQALQNRAKVQRDSINYFPPSATQACRLGFFSDLSDRAMPWDQVELSDKRACLGRLYFKVPGGIKLGQHWLNVKFRDSLIRVPFRILTEDEEKLLSKNFKAISEQVKEAFSPKK